MQHEYHRVPVTALAFWSQDVILAGEGSSLKAYDTERKNLLADVDVFRDQAIHGIIAEHDSIFVWGGRSLCQVAVNHDLGDSLVLNVGPAIEAEDWILDASFSPVSPAESLQVALVTAHNALAIAVLSKSLTLTLDPVVPGSNCILYAAHVTWLSPSQCLIASGTAFGDVIVWSCSIEKKDGHLLPAHQTHYTFSAHEGSVFGVKISPPSIASALGGRKHILASCSDDRTVRLWDISDLSSKTYASGEELRQTGFGSKSSDDSSAPRCLGKAMGHISRIWHVCFEQKSLEDNQAGELDQVQIISFGEDASFISWMLEAKTNDHYTYSMTQTEVQKAHTGKNIWSVAIDRSLRVATGGADGSIALRSFDDLQGYGPARAIAGEHLDDDVQIDNLRTYAFIGPAKMVATTNSGKFVMQSFDANGTVSSKQLCAAMDDLRGYSTMASVPGIAFSAGSRGSVYAYIYDVGKIVRVIETGSKVAGLFSCSPELLGDGSPAQSELLITNVASGTALLCKIGLKTEVTVTVEKYALTLPSNFVVTSFAHAVHDGKEIVILGSRNGSIAAYMAPDFGEDASRSHVLLCSSVHGKEAVTCLTFVKNNDKATESISFLSTGRDGTYAVHMLNSTSKDIQLDTVHQLSLPFGPNVEGVGYSLDGSLWTWGFRSKQFIVWDTDSQQEVMKVECGGANRNWAFHIGRNGGSFVWTKASKVYHETHNRLPFRSINPGGHGRETKSLAISPIESQLIATGAEDTDIKLSIYSNGTFRCLHTLQKHNTGIQHLQWSTDGRHLFSSGGFEEFYIWKISYDVPGLRIGVLCEFSHPNSGTSDLRIMHFGARSCGADFDITMVYSDSTVRAWRYYAARTWSLLATGNYLTSCLTQCLPVSDGETSLITGSTDGYLGTWTTSIDRKCVEWNDRHQIHQSAILAMLSCDLLDGSRLIITGGDDNAIGFTRMMASGGGNRTLLVPRAHAAAVTALSVVSEEADRIRVVSASIDQRIKLWKIDVDISQPGVDGINIKLLGNSFTAVADVCSIDTIRLSGGQSGVLVCGVGMDIWKLENRSGQ